VTTGPGLAPTRLRWFTYAPGRGQEHALALLRGYRGLLQCDGYAAYKQLGGRQGATPVFCWSHVRRGFYDVAKGGDAPVATEALARIARLYEIEAGIRGKSAAHRLAVRQTESRPQVAGLRAWFELQMTRLAARGPTAEAIRYALNHWDGLVRFLEDGRIDVDTNPVERAIRPVGLYRGKRPFDAKDNLIRLKPRQAAGNECGERTSRLERCSVI
jgi:transposase